VALSNSVVTATSIPLCQSPPVRLPIVQDARRAFSNSSGSSNASAESFRTDIWQGATIAFPPHRPNYAEMQSPSCGHSCLSRTGSSSTVPWFVWIVIAVAVPHTFRLVSRIGRAGRFSLPGPRALHPLCRLVDAIYVFGRCTSFDVRTHTNFAPGAPKLTPRSERLAVWLERGWRQRECD